MLEEVYSDLVCTAEKTGQSFFSREFARNLDNADALRDFRAEFHVPPPTNFGTEVSSDFVSMKSSCIYLNGNSLGLQPKRLRKFVNDELDNWASKASYSRRDGGKPWEFIDQPCVDLLAPLVGAQAEEVSVMNALSVNLHLMLTSFYRPTSSRYKILIEDGCFSSDRLCFESQVRLHGLDVGATLVTVSPRPGESCLRTEDIVSAIAREGPQLALVVFGGINFHTGEFLDIARITRAAHDQKCLAGFDLAHCVGNVPLKLHEWGVDFAVWCTYKYLNSGHGGIGGLFLHRRHAHSDLPRLAGWWGIEYESRFNFSTGDKKLMPGAAGYHISNVPFLLATSLLSSLEVIDEAGLDRMLAKSRRLTAYLELLLTHLYPSTDWRGRLYARSDSLVAGMGAGERPAPSSNGVPWLESVTDLRLTAFTETRIQIITPDDPSRRGAQLSLKTPFSADLLNLELEKFGVVCDVRGTVLRIAPVPLYNRFEDVFRFVAALGFALRICSTQQSNGFDAPD